MYSIRLAHAEDISVLADVERSAERAFHILSWYEPSDRTVPQEQLQDMARAGLVWVAVVGKHIAGFAACRAMSAMLYVHEVSVAFERQKQGIGTMLMKEVIQAAKDKGYTAIGLTTWRNAKWNMPFYQSLGFEEVAIEADWPQLYEQLQKEIEQGFPEARRCAMVKIINSPPTYMHPQT